MIINEVKGNAVSMYLREEGHLIHGCNCFNNMGAGIAKEVKRRIPDAHVVDCMTTKGSKDKLGNCSILHRKTNFVFNAYTQYDFRGTKANVDYTAIGNAFRYAVTYCKIHGSTLPIITPLIGAGLAGGDWKKIRAIIEAVTDDYPIIVVHFDPQAE